MTDVQNWCSASGNRSIGSIPLQRAIQQTTKTISLVLLKTIAAAILGAKETISSPRSAKDLKTEGHKDSLRAIIKSISKMH